MSTEVYVEARNLNSPVSTEVYVEARNLNSPVSTEMYVEAEEAAGHDDTCGGQDDQGQVDRCGHVTQLLVLHRAVLGRLVVLCNMARHCHGWLEGGWVRDLSAWNTLAEDGS